MGKLLRLRRCFANLLAITLGLGARHQRGGRTKRATWWSLFCGCCIICVWFNALGLCGGSSRYWFGGGYANREFAV